MTQPRLPLRITDPALREGVREVAAYEHISQNQYIAQAIRNDLVYRGQLRAQQLRATAARLNQLSEQAYADVAERSLAAFAEGEVGPDPLEMTALHSASPRSSSPEATVRRVRGIMDAVTTAPTS